MGIRMRTLEVGRVELISGGWEERVGVRAAARRVEALVLREATSLTGVLRTRGLDAQLAVADQVGARALTRVGAWK